MQSSDRDMQFMMCKQRLRGDINILHQTIADLKGRIIQLDTQSASCKPGELKKIEKQRHECQLKLDGALRDMNAYRHIEKLKAIIEHAKDMLHLFALLKIQPTPKDLQSKGRLKGMDALPAGLYKQWYMVLALVGDVFIHIRDNELDLQVLDKACHRATCLIHDHILAMKSIHDYLAISGSLQSEVNGIIHELERVFDKKNSLFFQKIKEASRYFEPLAIVTHDHFKCVGIKSQIMDKKCYYIDDHQQLAIRLMLDLWSQFSVHVHHNIKGMIDLMEQPSDQERLMAAKDIFNEMYDQDPLHENIYPVICDLLIKQSMISDDKVIDQCVKLRGFYMHIALLLPEDCWVDRLASIPLSIRQHGKLLLFSATGKAVAVEQMDLDFQLIEHIISYTHAHDLDWFKEPDQIMPLMDRIRDQIDTLAAMYDQSGDLIVDGIVRLDALRIIEHDFEQLSDCFLPFAQRCYDQGQRLKRYDCRQEPFFSMRAYQHMRCRMWGLDDDAQWRYPQDMFTKDSRLPPMKKYEHCIKHSDSDHVIDFFNHVFAMLPIEGQPKGGFSLLKITTSEVMMHALVDLADHDNQSWLTCLKHDRFLSIAASDQLKDYQQLQLAMEVLLQDLKFKEQSRFTLTLLIGHAISALQHFGVLIDPQTIGKAQQSLAKAHGQTQRALTIVESKLRDKAPFYGNTTDHVKSQLEAKNKKIANIVDPRLTDAKRRLNDVRLFLLHYAKSRMENDVFSQAKHRHHVMLIIGLSASTCAWLFVDALVAIVMFFGVLIEDLINNNSVLRYGFSCQKMQDQRDKMQASIKSMIKQQHQGSVSMSSMGGNASMKQLLKRPSNVKEHVIKRDSALRSSQIAKYSSNED